MALSDQQKDVLQEIVGLVNRDEVTWRANYMTAAQEASVIDDLDLWLTVRDKHLKIKGGPDGVDLDNSRIRGAIINRCKLRMAMTDGDMSGVVRLVRS